MFFFHIFLNAVKYARKTIAKLKNANKHEKLKLTAKTAAAAKIIFAQVLIVLSPLFCPTASRDKPSQSSATANREAIIVRVDRLYAK